MSLMYRQGDIAIIKIDKLPPEARLIKEPGDVVLALGEVTGHKHRFETNVTAFYKEGDDHTMNGGTALRGTRTNVEFITVGLGGADLLHEEHDTIHHEAGDYKIVRQREFDSLEGVRRVAD